MLIEDWAARWKDGRIGFHEGRTNTYLAKYIDRLGAAPKRVLVPLCGKAEDMAFLASRGHAVIGIEAVEEAAEAFFREHDLLASRQVRPIDPHVRVHSAANIDIFVGDVFACTKDLVGAVDALYDRAAIVALPEDVRKRYVAHVRQLLAPGSAGLVITFDYDQAKMSPPPYAVSHAELRALYEGAEVEVLDVHPLDSGRFHDAGVDAVETCFAIRL